MPSLSRERLQHEQRLEQHLKEMPFYVVEYVRAKKRAHLSPSTLLGYVHDFKIFFEWLQSEGIVQVDSIKDISLETLEKLKKKDVEFFIDYLYDSPFEYRKGVMKKRSHDRVIRNINALKSLFNYLTQETENDEGECYFYRNVFSKIKTFKKKVSKSSRAKKISSVILTLKEIDEFIQFLECEYEQTLSSRQKSRFMRDKERDIAIIALAFGTGLRVTELANITIEDVDFHKMQIDVIRKGDKADTILATEWSLHYLKQYLSIRKERYKAPGDQQYVFLTKYDGNASPISVRTIQENVKKYTKAFNDGKAISPHKLRHSFESEWLRSGGNLVLLRDQLGHNSIETTSLYTNLTNEDARKVIDRMENKLEK
ncbi:tyrosine recombinase XerS [Bacillus sp. FJAT-47783]|uniref:tyrosine recombinase XerS n=1 Tax=Bacillus sp. FJAT-47783 TaxID=2922712 RepID=UPI001FAD9175|nr:tyrosine recombinase XerS [Bacillus sp. FJAT-47783]